LASAARSFSIMAPNVPHYRRAPLLRASGACDG
jgi:hypothetical protein